MSPTAYFLAAINNILQKEKTQKLIKKAAKEKELNKKLRTNKT